MLAAGATSWVERRPLLTARADFAAGLLPDGRVIVAGGTGAATAGIVRPQHPGQFVPRERALDSTEIYDPRTGAWAEAAPLAEARTACAGCVDWERGRFVVSGGRGEQAGPMQALLPLASVESFLPAEDRYDATLLSPCPWTEL